MRVPSLFLGKCSANTSCKRLSSVDDRGTNVAYFKIGYLIASYGHYLRKFSTLYKENASREHTSERYLDFQQADWHAEQFQRAPINYWDDKEHHIILFEWLSSKLGILVTDDWYKITTDMLGTFVGRSLFVTHYNNSIIVALTILYPETDWQIWRFQKVPAHFWNNERHQRQFLEWLAVQERIECVEGWYKVTVDVVDKYGGLGLIRHYHDSLIAALLKLFPQQDWLVWKFPVVPKNFWHDKENHLHFFEWLAHQLHITTLEGWYSVVEDVIEKHGAGGLLDKYDHSPIQALTTLYPEATWQPSAFCNVPRQYWYDSMNHRNFFDWCAEQLQINQTDGWYGVTQEIIDHYGGAGLLHYYYGGSPCEALLSVFPDTGWLQWMFGRNSRRNGDNSNQYIAWLEDKMRIQSPHQWYSVTTTLLGQNQGAFLSSQQSLHQLLGKQYPECSWESTPWMLGQQSKIELHLSKSLQEILPKHIAVEVQSGPPFAGTAVELVKKFDAWIPELNLVVEYQGEQHYIENSFIHDDHGWTHQFDRDINKRHLVENNHITFVEVPFWWDHSCQTLASTLNHVACQL